MITKYLLKRAVGVVKSQFLNRPPIKISNTSPAAALISYIPKPDPSEFGKVPLENLVDSVVDSIPEEEYREVLDACVVELAPQFREYLILLREKINPAICYIAENVLEVLEEGKNSLSIGYSVVEGNMPEILVNPEFLNVVETFSARVLPLSKPLPFTPTFPPLPEPTLKEILDKAGYLTDDLLPLIKLGGLLRIYNDVFNSQTRSGEDAAILFSWRENGGLERAIVSFHLALAFKENIPEGVRGSESEFIDFINITCEQSSYAIKSYIDRLEGDANMGNIISSVDEKNIYVNPLLYRKWIGDGGDVELIYGTALTKWRTLSNISEIEKHREEVLRDWSTQKKFLVEREKGSRIMNVRATIERCFLEALARFFPDGEEGGLPNDEAARRGKEMLEGVNFGEVISNEYALYDFARHLVCDSKFTSSGAEKFFASIDSYKSENPNLTISEAATLSAINYLATNLLD